MNGKELTGRKFKRDGHIYTITGVVGNYFNAERTGISDFRKKTLERSVKWYISKNAFKAAEALIYVLAENKTRTTFHKDVLSTHPLIENNLEHIKQDAQEEFQYETLMSRK
jgi:hypothetical protein